MTTTTTRRPVQVDTELARIWLAQAQVRAQIAGTIETAHRVAGDRGRYVSRSRKVWDISTADALAKVAEIAATSDKPWTAREASDLLARRAGYLATLAALDTEAAPFQAEYAAAPWTRFFIVPAGHIHSSMDCSTCNNGTSATSFGWLPALSGLTEADAVAAEGSLLCTVCYPTAPVEWTNGYEVAEAAKAAARCPGSGEYVPSNGGRRYVACPSCSATVARTPSGLVRAHKPA